MKKREYINNYLNDLKEGFITFKNDYKSKNYFKQLPNTLTLSRFPILLVVILTYMSGNPLISGGAYAIGGLTDLIDGYIARKYNLRSKFGEKLDTILDKLYFVLPALFITISNPFLIALLIGEALIAITNIKALSKGYQAHSSKIGKLKTWFLFSSIVIYFFTKINLSPTMLNCFNIGLITTSSISLLLQSVSIITYEKENRKHIKVIKENDEKFMDELQPENNKSVNDLLIYKNQVVNEVKVQSDTKEKQRSFKI